MVQKDAAEIRQKLDALVDVLMKDPTTPCGSQLKDLARAGRELYNDLFQVGVRGSEVDSAVVRSWLQGKLEPHRLSVVVDTYVHVPWGLVFDGDPELIPDDAFDIESYKDFWCLKFLLSCSYKGLDPSIAEHGERSNEFRLVPVLHQGEYDLSKWKVDDPEGVAFNKVLEEFGGGISDFKSLMSAGRCCSS
jgi:hypothetical protein